jgi:hypothetical protein
MQTVENRGGCSNFCQNTYWGQCFLGQISRGTPFWVLYFYCIFINKLIKDLHISSHSLSSTHLCTYCQLCNISGRLPVCYQDCILGDWEEWSPCSQSCGSDGVQERIRQVDNPAKKGGRACDPKVERRICLLAECPDT